MIEQLILGAIQGIFEWLPVSSEGITALASQFLMDDVNAVDFSLFLHLGTLLAVLIYFRKDWAETFSFKNKRLLRFLVIATIFSLIAGYPFYIAVSNVAIGNTLLLIVGFSLFLTAYFQKREKKLNIDIDKLAMISGLLQGLAVIPGLSRSGSTIFGLSLGRLSPSEILKYSYMMSVPVVLASNLFVFLKDPNIALGNWPALISSFIVGLASLHLLINISKKINFFWFAFVFGIICVLGGLIGLLT